MKGSEVDTVKAVLNRKPIEKNLGVVCKYSCVVEKGLNRI